MSQLNNPEADASIPNAPDQTRTEYSQLDQLQPSVLYELNQQALDSTLSEGPLIEDVAPLSVLRAEYEANDNNVFVREIDWLIANGFNGFRRVKGDGDCFYRAFVFSFVKQILEAPEVEMSVAMGLSILISTKQLLNETGVQELVYEDFYDQTVSLLENVVKPDQDGQVLTLNRLLEFFRNPENSNTIVMYFRLVTASQIQANVDAYENFLFHPETKELMTVPDYCNRVMGLGKEADHAEIQALCDALCLNVEVAYLGGHSKDEVNFVKIPDTPYVGSQPIVLLYRPGHYDILIK